MVIRFFTHVAQEVREILAELGFRGLDEIIGRADLLEQVPNAEGRAGTLDLTSIVTPADPAGERPRRRLQPRNARADQPLDEQIIRDAAEALEGNGTVCLAYDVHNQNRAVGTRLSGEIAYRYGDEGLADGSIECHLQGSAGQSLGAFLTRGVRLILTGEANDYVGKGMGGGEIAIRPPDESKLTSHENVIIGNTVLYGATGGSLFAAGRAGERFAVRNSGAKAVVEGVGDHGCEYMTEGVVAILGETGRNFGAGMSNGIAYVLDETGDFPSRLNPEMVHMKRVRQEEDVDMLRALILRHVQLTGSPRGQDILDRWDHYLPLFWKVAPHAAMTEEGPMTIIHRHLESVLAAAGMG
jgi:glutamate synthase domain-containing protein 3